jgi:hypothetical protein
MSRQAAALIFATLVFLGGQTLAHAQAAFGKPVAVDESRIPQKKPQVSNPQGPKEIVPAAADKPSVPQKLQAPQGPKEPVRDEFGLKPPTRDELFRVQSEQSLKERLRQELPKVKKVDFPKEASLPEVPGENAPFPERFVSPIAGQVCYRPLYFEDKRTERFGKYVPCMQPLLSAGRFYGDVAILPCRLLLTPPWTFECDNR